MTSRRRTILFVVNHAGFFLSHRLPIALAAREAGYDVQVATPRSKHVPKVQALGFAWNEIRLWRSSRNPFRELRSLISIYRTYRRVKPDLVHHVTSKPVLYGTPLARLARVPAVVNAISGMGHVFAGAHAPGALFRKAVALGYRLSLRHRNMRVIFQNTDHETEFLGERWVSRDEARLIRGSGADTSVFKPRESGRNDIPVIVFASRMLYTKGVVEFVDAARRLKQGGASARFVLVGEPDPDNLASVSEEQLQQWAREGTVEYWRRREDMPDVFRQADIAALPTFYPEGIPKVLIEAAASGLPIVTTDWPGCREIVNDGVNGLLVPVRDSEALAAAMKKLIDDPALRERMGKAGRQRVLDEFSTDHVVRKTLEIYKELLG